MSSQHKAIPFYKYEGTGNDFIIIHVEKAHFPYLPKTGFSEEFYMHPSKSFTQYIRGLCDRHHGIGADGLLFIHLSSASKLESLNIYYYNADGTPGFCINGIRCAVALAYKLKLVASVTQFQSAGRAIHAHISDQETTLNWQDKILVQHYPDGDLVELAGIKDYGSIHFIQHVKSIPSDDKVYTEGRTLRHDARFLHGANIHFVSQSGTEWHIRSFEKGVEAPTLSCATGAVAVAYLKSQSLSEVRIHTLGGPLCISFEEENCMLHITLRGAVRKVYEGTLDPSLL